MNRTLLYSFSILVLSPLMPGASPLKKETTIKTPEITGAASSGYASAQYPQTDEPIEHMVSERKKIWSSFVEPPRKRKTVQRKRTLYTPYPAKDKFPRDGSRLKITVQ